MSEYIKSMLAETVKRLDSRRLTDGMNSRFRALAEELRRLDPRDFLPANRLEFVTLRRKISNYLELTEDDWDVVAKDAVGRHPRSSVGHLLRILNRIELADEHEAWANLGENGCNPMANGIINGTRQLLNNSIALMDSHVSPGTLRIRKFPYIKDQGLRQIVERDYHELVAKLFPIESWKCVVVMAGSILEGLLYDLLTRDALRIADAETASRAPKSKKPPKGPRKLQSTSSDDQWMLNDFIEVADQLKLIPADWKAGVQSVLREFRNCVHPRKELSMSDKITQGEAFLAVGALMRICDHIEKNHP